MNRMKHGSHEHELKLIKEVDVNMAGKAMCGVCEMPLVGGSDPVYTCLEKDCLLHFFFLHRKCAYLPPQITHLNHRQHPLTLGHHFNHEVPNSLVPDSHLCDLCGRQIHEETPVYYCEVCRYVVPFPELFTKSVTLFRYGLCIGCALVEPVLHHQGHEQHILNLVAKDMYSNCDACGGIGRDMCYTCLPCQFWIHRTCALSPPTIKLPFHQDDTLNLIYSIPPIYHAFKKHCRICKDRVMEDKWAYFCQDSGYFVHIKCATTLLASGENFEIISEEKNQGETYLELPHFPLLTTDSLTAILAAEYRSSNRIEEIEEDDIDYLLYDSDDDEEVQEEALVINHWSHLKHSLILLEEFKDVHYDERNRIHDMLVCSGCTMPISNQNKYYGCIGCNFFLHTSCANHLPLTLAPGRCVSNPQHYLHLLYISRITPCTKCLRISNGFRYGCYICGGTYDIFCCLAPKMIKHSYHSHPLLQHFISREDLSHTTADVCNACLKKVIFGFGYRCETCSEIQICQCCALSFPKIVCHRWDPHEISLIYPPIYYKGSRYCETCELEVNQEAWMYRCSECDLCFHPTCILPHYNMKLGSTVDLINFHHHKLTLVTIDKDRYPDRIHKSFSCSQGHEDLEGEMLYLNCAPCNHFTCLGCALEHVELEIFLS